MTPPCRTVLIALFLALLALAATPQGGSAQGTRLSVDADPADNGPVQVGPLNSCISVAIGDRLEVDIILEDVDELLAWEVYFAYDPTIVEIVQRDVRLFQAANPGSSVYDVSESLPDDDGLYRLAAADTADPPSPDSGSGVLARLTLDAIASGVSTASLVRRDLNGDGKPDQGPFLRNLDGLPIGDADGDTLFDGDDASAEIAVDTACSPDSINPTSGGKESSGAGGLRTAIILGSIIAAGILAGLSAFAVLYRRRARAQPP